MSPKKLALLAAGLLAAIFVAGAVAGLVVFQSNWFRNQVRERVIALVQDASGGRAEVGSFQFDLTTLRVELRDVVLHGTEPAGKPPLGRASSIVAGLKIVSLLRQKADVRYVSIQDPRIHLIVDPDGRTNVPEPKIKRRSERTAMDTLFNLAVGQFSLQNGVFEVESQTRIPFDVRGNNLAARFTYEPAGPRYHGNISIQPLQVRWDGQTQAPLGIQIATVLERNRIGISSARLASGQSNVQLSGAIEDLAAPHANFQYEARIVATDLARALHVPGLERGTVQLAGNAQWTGGANYIVTGNLHVSGGEVRQAPWSLQNLRADGALRADPQGMQLGGLRFSGESVDPSARLPVSGQAGALTLRGADLELRNLQIAALGGSFTGDAILRNGDRFEVRGDLHGLQARHAVGVYSREPLPWDSLVSGPVQIEGSLRRQKDLRVSANLAVAPAAQSPAVRGQVAILYDRSSGTLELGRSTLQLPASRVELSGAIGRRLRVHLETRDISEFLPLLGESVTTVPVRLENGSAVFDGTVSGKLEDPRITGHLTLTRFSYEGRSFDSLQADATASPENLHLQNANLARGMARAQFQLTLGLDSWKAGDSSSLAGNGAIRNAAVADVLSVLGENNPGLEGTASATGQVAGTVGLPQWTADIEVAKGSIRDEPFDRFAAHVSDDGRRLQVSSGQLSAGAKQLQLAATFDHAANRFDTGRLQFQTRSNVLPLAGIRTFAQSRPGIQGTVQITVSGAMTLARTPGAAESFRLTELQADVEARGLQVTGQPLGDAHLTANSQGPVLRAHLDTSFNGSAVRGDGEWRMEGDYPGNATVTFTKLDLAGLREWISPSPTHAPYPFNGFAEGEIRVDGPVLKPDLLQADVRIPNLEIRPVSSGAGIVLRNSGPIVAHVAKSEITIDKAELTGRSTDVTISGKAALAQRNPLDLRVTGRVDLAILQTWNPDIDASGLLNLEAAVRGSLSAPQVNGRAELKNGAASYGMLPNGITNANGVILFTGERATIQNLQAGTGGGKIQLSGFTGYGGGGLIFGLHARTQQVRIRYPEGISTVSDGDLDFTGSPDRSLLAGTVTIQRASVNLQSDFGTFLAKSAQPVQTPPARSGFLAGLNFDVTIQTAPDIVFESALTQDIEADANLRLRGTATNPALLGRINITQGELAFFGTKYTINQGSITFSNPIKVEPILNVDLNTRARGIDITLSVTGPLSKPNVTPRSDPPMQFSEIISLLTTGDAPISDFTRLSQQSSTALSFQQSNATALLGQVIANPVSGRLQRFFGVSKLRINPTLDPALANGVQYNPQARLTIEQQVTPDVTFTYVTNLTNANPQVVSVEWSVSKQWSVVAQREENGLVGLDFYLKKRFK